MNIVGIDLSSRKQVEFVQDMIQHVFLQCSQERSIVDFASQYHP